MSVGDCSTVQVTPQGNILGAQEAVSVLNSCFVPDKMDQYIDLIEFSDKGELFLATSALNKRSWTGDLWWFGNPEDASSPDKARTAYRLDSGIVTGKFLGKKQLIVGLDSGGIKLFTAATVSSSEEKDGSEHVFECLPAVSEHDDQLTDLDTWSGGGENYLVTVGREGRIVVWNKHLAVLKVYYPAHNSVIRSVACHPTNNNMFATVGEDGTIKVWNTSDSKPCTTVYSDPLVPPAVVSWVSNLTAPSLLVGSRTGSVFVLDVESQKAGPSLVLGDRDVRKLSWSPDGKLCGVVCDDVTVFVVSVNNNNVSLKYSNQTHSDLVRSVAWNPVDGKLWSAGWDKKVLSHSL